MSIRHKIAFVFFALGLSISPVGSSPVLSADNVITVTSPQLVAIPTVPSPVPSPVPTSSAAPSESPPAPAPVQREINVALSGDQDAVDLGQGPVLFPLPSGFPPYIVEHDLYGGTERFGTLREGMTVRMTGLITGTYTVGQIINVPNTGTTKEFKAYNTMPKVMLQTCITGTDRMIIVGLY